MPRRGVRHVEELGLQCLSRPFAEVLTSTAAWLGILERMLHFKEVRNR